MKKINLLFSGLGGSLFPYLHDQLSNKYNLYYLDNDIHLISLYSDLNFYHAPLVTESAYWDLVKKVIKENKINFYIPLIDEEIIDALNIINGFKSVKIIAPSIKFCNLSLNKFTLMNELSSLNISTIQSYMGDKFNWEIAPPVFVKPVSGRGSRGIRRINNASQLDAYYKLEGYSASEILIQQNITGVEYTVGVLTNNLNQVLSISSKRIIRKKGITQMAITENNLIIDEISRKVVSELKPCGPINIQLILTSEKKAKIFEINPRFSTTTIMEYEGGIDLISAYIKYYDKKYKGEILRPKKDLTLHRRWENIFYYDK